MPFDKETLIEYRIKRCLETIDEAEKALADDHLNLTANRIYYSVFYAVSALAVKYNFSTSKHSALLSWFNKNFVKEGIIIKELGKIYNKAFLNRMKGDYDDFVNFSAENLNADLNKMKKLVEQIIKIINEN